MSRELTFLRFRVTGVVLIFVEIPLLMRICPTSEKFDTFVRRFNENWPRAGMYVRYLPLPPTTSHLPSVPIGQQSNTIVFLRYSSVVLSLAPRL